MNRSPLKKSSKHPASQAKESDIQRQILEWLAYEKIFHYRNNSGAFKREDGHFYRFGAVGSPDVICVIGGQYIGIEVKGKTGKQSDHQKEFPQELEKAGGKSILARTLEDVDELKRLKVEIEKLKGQQK